MAIQMELYELKNLCMEMASLGAANYVKQTIPAKDLISQREAYRLFQLSVAVALYIPKYCIHVPNLWQWINQRKSTL
jgi:hypothetical protein